MALFDFVKHIGKKLFPAGAKKEEAATQIRHEIEAARLGIVGLDVTYDDGKVRLSGKAPSAAAMQKAVLIAGNLEGVESVDISGMQVPPVVAVVEDVDYYVIEKGDTLSKIAKRYYGDAKEYPRIFEANREVIRDADLIFPGQKIRIPKARAPVA
jgi:nucleoid-associated protein YgaU